MEPKQHQNGSSSTVTISIWEMHIHFILLFFGPSSTELGAVNVHTCVLETIRLVCKYLNKCLFCCCFFFLKKKNLKHFIYGTKHTVAKILDQTILDTRMTVFMLFTFWNCKRNSGKATLRCTIAGRNFIKQRQCHRPGSRHIY